MVKNHCLAKSISDAAWYRFREWLEYFGVVYGVPVIAVNPSYTSADCSNCGQTIVKTLSSRTLLGRGERQNNSEVGLGLILILAN
jgi:putative transposase